MGKSILELFQTERISFPDGKVQTAKEYYAIRDSKQIETESKNPLLFLSFKTRKGLRKAFSVKDRETLFEEEFTGIRPLMLLSGPALYGTDLARLQNKTTDMMDEMRAASGGQITKGLLGGVKKFVQKVARLGIKATPQLIPTVIAKNTDFKSGKENETPDTLQKILSSNNRKGIGKFLATNVKGGFNENLGKRLISAGIDAVKQKAQKILLGSRNEAGQNLAKSGGIYNSSSPYSKTVDYTNLTILDRNDLSSNYQNIFNSVIANLFSPVSKKIVDNEQIITGPKYNKNPIQKKPIIIPNVAAPLSYKNTFNPTVEYLKQPNVKANATHNTRGFGYGLRGDILNEVDVANNNSAGNVIVPFNGGTTTDALDFVPFKFENLASSNVVIFRASISSLSETFSPNWDSKTFVGNPLPFYSYGHIERAIVINFKVFSLSVKEHAAAWRRLAELARMVYPQKFTGTAKKATAPFIKLTLGDMFKDKVGFIESMTYTIPDNTPWEIGMNGGVSDEYKAPMVIEVELTYKFLLNRDQTPMEELYDFGGCKGTAQTTNQGTAPNPQQGASSQGTLKTVPGSGVGKTPSLPPTPGVTPRPAPQIDPILTPVRGTSITKTSIPIPDKLNVKPIININIPPAPPPPPPIPTPIPDVDKVEIPAPPPTPPPPPPPPNPNGGGPQLVVEGPHESFKDVITVISGYKNTVIGVIYVFVKESYYKTIINGKAQITGDIQREQWYEFNMVDRDNWFLKAEKVTPEKYNEILLQYTNQWKPKVIRFGDNRTDTAKKYLKSINLL